MLAEEVANDNAGYDTIANQPVGVCGNERHKTEWLKNMERFFLKVGYVHPQVQKRREEKERIKQN